MFYIFCSEKKSFLKRKVKEKSLAFLETINSLNYVEINADNYNNLNNIINICLETPLLGDKKVVVIENAIFLLKGNVNSQYRTNLINFLNKKNDNFLIFFLIYSYKVIFDAEIHQNLIKNHLAEICYFNLLNENSWLKYAQSIIKDKKIDIQDVAMKELVKRTLNDDEKLDNEITKLFLLQKPIVLKDVINLVSTSIENNVFLLLNNLLSGDLSSSLQIFYFLIGSNEFKNNHYLLNILTNQFRFFYLCSFLFDKEQNVIKVANQLKANIIRVKIVLNKIKKIKKNILNILDDIYYMDCKIKSNQIDKNLAFEMFIINFEKKYFNS